MNIDTEQGMQEAVQWMHNHLITLKEGGKWVIPRSGMVVTLDNWERREVTLHGPLDYSTVEVLEAGGWKITYA